MTAKREEANGRWAVRWKVDPWERKRPTGGVYQVNRIKIWGIWNGNEDTKPFVNFYDNHQMVEVVSVDDPDVWEHIYRLYVQWEHEVWSMRKAERDARWVPDE